MFDLTLEIRQQRERKSASRKSVRCRFNEFSDSSQLEKLIPPFLRETRAFGTCKSDPEHPAFVDEGITLKLTFSMFAINSISGRNFRHRVRSLQAVNANQEQPTLIVLGDMTGAVLMDRLSRPARTYGIAFVLAAQFIHQTVRLLLEKLDFFWQIEHEAVSRLERKTAGFSGNWLKKRRCATLVCMTNWK